MDLHQLSIEYDAHDLALATDNFNVRCRLGIGSYGSVYKGVMKDGTEVAIKVIDIHSDSGFEEEVRVLSRFRHPNVVILLGFARSGSRRFLVYECLSGGDVGRRLQQSDCLCFSWHQRLSVALDAACGLSHLHNSNPKVFHRDIKSANILLDRNGTAKMADFGLACLSHLSSFRVKQASGTVGYACPHYIQKGVVSEASEIYSFGMVLFELVCNLPPASSGNLPGEVQYLVNHFKGDLGRVMKMLDSTAQWPGHIASRVSDLAISCTSLVEGYRPTFLHVVKTLRLLFTGINTTTGPSGKTVCSLSSTQSTPSPPMQYHHSHTFSSSPLFFLVVISSIKKNQGIFEPDPSSENLLVFGRLRYSKLLEELVQNEQLRNTISREHFSIRMEELEGKKRSRLVLSHFSQNLIMVNERVLGKGDSIVVEEGDRIALLSSAASSSQAKQKTSEPVSFLVLEIQTKFSKKVDNVFQVGSKTEVAVLRDTFQKDRSVKLFNFDQLVFGYSFFPEFFPSEMTREEKHFANELFSVTHREFSSGRAKFIIRALSSVGLVITWERADKLTTAFLAEDERTQLFSADVVSLPDYGISFEFSESYLPHLPVPDRNLMEISDSGGTMSSSIKLCEF